MNILEQDCKVAQLFADAAISRKDRLYLGLDISTQSTGYAVLRPYTGTMAAPMDSSSRTDKLALLRDMGEANLVEWGYISGTDSGGKKGDEVDVGVIVEETLMQVAARCGVCSDGKAPPETTSRLSPLSTEPSEQEGSGEGLGVDEATVGESSRAM